MAPDFRCVSHLGFVLSLASALVGCKGSEPPALSPLPGLESVALTTVAGAQTPNVVAGGDGALALTWQESKGGVPVVRYSLRAGDGTLSAPATLASDAKLFVNWADFPAMMTLDGGAVAAWLQHFDSGYGIRFATRARGAATFADAAQLHTHTTGPEYGFVSMTPLGPDQLAVFWLDGRASGGHSGGGAMQLRGAKVAVDGTVSERRLVDDRVCDCCQTAAANTDAGPVVVYRDRSEGEVRDIAIAGPKADQRRVIASDDWMIAGCPVNGPAIASSTEGLVVAWYTGANNKAAVRVAFADHEGEFSAPVNVDLGQTLGRVDVEWLDAEHALVTFVESAATGADAGVLVARTLSRSGALGPPWTVASVSASNATGFPRMARAGDQIVWAWTDALTEPSQVRVAQAAVAGLVRG